jgi:hypothetical protein
MGQDAGRGWKLFVQKANSFTVVAAKNYGESVIIETQQEINSSYFTNPIFFKICWCASL